MRLIKLIICILMLVFFILPVEASEITAPPVPEAGREVMPEKTDSFGEGLAKLVNQLILQIRPELKQALRTCMMVLAGIMVLSVLRLQGGHVSELADFVGTVAIALILMEETGSMIALGVDTVYELSEYGKLLLPVMTAAAAAQGGLTSSAALYAGTMVFDTVLSALIANVLVPAVYVFLAFSAGGNALGEDILKKIRDLLKTVVGWTLKTLLTVFTTYMGITGVVSGTTDAAALKATKLTISSVVPVVGGILSDASEAVLVSAGLAKNAAGIYGILALLAVFVTPFVKIGVRYLLLKGTALISGIFDSKRTTGLVEDVAAAMGLLLAMTGSVCLLLMISTVCFMKGMG